MHSKTGTPVAKRVNVAISNKARNTATVDCFIYFTKKGNTMKLAEALLERADAQKRYAQTVERIKRVVKVQSGDAPAESPETLMRELEGLANRITELVQRINRTNCLTAFDANQTLADALALRDILLQKRNAFAAFAETATTTQDRYSRSEIKFEAVINVAETQKRADNFAKLYRECDAKVQAMNWTTELAA
jgi:hypothetical protein